MNEITPEALRFAIKKTEYKYFGDYEMFEDQRAAVDTLVAFVEQHLELLAASSGERGAAPFLSHLREVNSERLAAWEQPEPLMLCEHCGSSDRETISCAAPFDRKPHSFTRPHPYITQEPRKTDGIFHAAELGGEVGEVLNVVKKLHREAMGWRGSRATVADLSEEIGDVLICLDKLAAHYGIDIEAATIAKFNATSDKVGLPHKLVASTPATVEEPKV